MQNGAEAFYQIINPPRFEIVDWLTQGKRDSSGANKLFMVKPIWREHTDEEMQSYIGWSIEPKTVRINLEDMPKEGEGV